MMALEKENLIAEKINAELNTALDKFEISNPSENERTSFFNDVFKHRHLLKPETLSRVEEKFEDNWSEFLSEKINKKVEEVLKSPFLLEDERKLFFNEVFQHQDILNKNMLLSVEQSFDNDWKTFLTEKITSLIKEALDEFTKDPAQFTDEVKESVFEFVFKYQNSLEKETLANFEKTFGDEWKAYSSESIESSKQGVARNFKLGHAEAFIKSIEAISSTPATDRVLEKGPLNKNESTVLLESMIKNLLADGDYYKFEIRNNDQLFAIDKSGKEDNMNNILQKADFNQLSFDTNHLDAYEKFLRDNNLEFNPQIAQRKDKDGEIAEGEIKGIDNLANKFDDNDSNGHLANLALAEKLAININTTNAFTPLSHLMRDQISQLNERQPSSSAVKELLLAGAIGVHGLNKISEQVPVSTFRVDENLPQHLIEERRQAAANQGITIEMGFTSTAMEKPAEGFSMSSPNTEKNTASAATVFRGLIGKYIAAISAVPKEREWLIPPTQVQWQNAADVNGKEYLVASPVRSPEAYRPTNPAVEPIVISDEKEKVSASVSKPVETQVKQDQLPLSSILKIRLKGGKGKLKVGKGKSKSTAKIKKSLKEISSLLSDYNSYTDKEKTAQPLLTEINKCMDMAAKKIASNAQKNDNELKERPKIEKNTETLLAQMKTLVAYGQTLTGDKDFGKDKIAEVDHSLKNASNKLTTLSDEGRQKNLAQAFLDGNTLEYEKSIKALSLPSLTDNALVQGPLNKNESTFLLESMLKSLLVDNNSVKFEIRDNNQMIATYQGNEHNMNEMLKKADFNQISFSDDELNTYEKFLRTENTELKPAIAVASKDDRAFIRSLEISIGDSVAKDKSGQNVIQDLDLLAKVFDAKDKDKGNLSNLERAHQYALNGYTQNAVYKYSNPMMRGQMGALSDLSPSTLKELILMTAMAVDGLNRISENVPLSTFRVDGALPTPIMNERIKAAENKDIIVEMGILSTAAEKPELTFSAILQQSKKTDDSEQQVGTVFTGLYGKNIAALSYFPTEKNEYAIPPTQLQISNAVKVGESNYVLASPVRTPGNVRTQEDLGLTDNANTTTYTVQESAPIADKPQIENNEAPAISPAPARPTTAVPVIKEPSVEAIKQEQLVLPQILEQRLTGGMGESTLVATKDINTALKEISSLLTEYNNYTTKDSKALESEINNFMALASMKIASNMQKNDVDFTKDPKLIKNTTIMLAQMEAAASIGKIISGDNNFGNEKIAKANNSITTVQDRLMREAPQPKSATEQFKQDEVMFKKYMEGGGENTEVLKRVFYAVQQGGLSDRPGDYTQNDASKNIPLAAALAHGGRIVIEIPKLQEGEDPEKFMSWIRGNNPNIFQREAATHSLEIDKEGNITELKLAGGIAAVTDLASYGSDYINNRHFGLNLGLSTDKEGNPVAALENGQNGHLYMYWMPPTKDKPGAFMVGCEASAPGEKNAMTGAAHGPGGKASEISLTGGAKWTDANTFGEYAPNNGLYVKLDDNQISHLENSKDYKTIQDNLGKLTGNQHSASFSTANISSPAEKVNTILDSLNIQTTTASLEKPNSYQYHEYHITENQKTDVVGTNNKLEVRVFDKDSYNRPKTEDFINRAISLHSTAVSMIPSEISAAEKEKMQKDLDASLDKTITAIREKAAIDPQKVQSEIGAIYYDRKLNAAMEILQQFLIDNLDTLHSKKTYDLGKAIDNYEKAESEIVAKAGRSNLLNVYEAAGHTRISISETQGNHTNPSTMRDQPELSNFVKVAAGYVDQDGKAQIEFEAYRHSSYPPIKIAGESIEEKMARREGAVKSVEQMLETIAREMLKDPNHTDPLEIKLSSMLLLTPLLKDQIYMPKGESEMRQLKDSLIALNICKSLTTLNIDGQSVAIKPVLSQMNIPANDVMKMQFKKMGGEFNDNINNKGFYEFHKNFMDFSKPLINDFENSKDLNLALARFRNDSALNMLTDKLETAQNYLNLTARYKLLGQFQKDPSMAAEYKAELAGIRAAEKELNGIYKEIITRQKEIWKDNKDDMRAAKEEIENKLETDPDNKSLQVAQLYLDSAEIYYSKSHKMAEHGHQFQTRYLLANQLMGNKVEFFCKSGEDRTGRANNHIEEFLAFRRENKFFPRFKNKDDLEKLKPISTMVHNGSVSIEITNQNAPGAKGLQQDSSFGSNKNLSLAEFDRKQAQTAKGVYNISLLKKSKHQIQIHLRNTALEKEFRDMANQMQDFLEKKVSNITHNDQPTKPDNSPVATPALTPTLPLAALLDLKAKADQVLTNLENNTNNFNTAVLELTKTYDQIRQLHRENTGNNLVVGEIKEAEHQIEARLNNIRHNVSRDIDAKTDRDTTSPKTTFSGTPIRPQHNSPIQTQNDILKTLQPVFKKTEFEMTAITNNSSISVKKIDEEKPFMSVTNKEIQAHSNKNSEDDYKLMIKSAMKMFDTPLLIYVPPSEKSELDKAINALKNDPDPKLRIKEQDVLITTSHKDYEIKQKEKTQASAPTSGTAPQPATKPGDEPHQKRH